MDRNISARGARHGLLLIALAALLWGTVGVSTRALYTLSATDALSIGFFRLALAAPLLLAGCLAVLRARAWRIAWRDMGLALLLGAFLGLYQVSYFTAVGAVGVTVAVLVTLCTAPVIAALLGAAVARERLTRPAGLALLCALAGTALLVGRGPEQGLGGGALAGVLFALAAAFCYASITVCGRLVAGSAHPLQVNAVAFSAGALLLLLIATPGGLATGYPAAGWGLLVYLGLGPTVLAYWLFMRGMASTSATTATIVTLLEPLTATLLAWLLFGERLGPLGLLGALLLLGAMAVLYRSAR